MSFKRKYLSSDNNPYFIAEIGINHNGQMSLAKKMIEASKKAGAKAVKFQKRDIRALLAPGAVIVEPTGYLSKTEHDIPSGDKKAFGTWTYPDKRLELTDSQHLELWKYAESIGLDYLISPWEEKSVDFLVKNKARIIKVASIDANNYQFCEYIAKKRIPTIISTGMMNYAEIQTTWSIFEREKCPMMFLHCTSAYPSPVEDKHLRCIPVLRQLFSEDVGFSGHAIGVEGTLGAVALGANVIEKHVTLSRKMNGPDHAASLEFSELADLVRMSRNMVAALGKSQKSFLPSEKVLHGVLSRRFVTVKPVKAGARLESALVTTMVTKKDGGILPNQYFNILGLKVKKSLPKGYVLNYEDLMRE